MSKPILGDSSFISGPRFQEFLEQSFLLLIQFVFLVLWIQLFCRVAFLLVLFYTICGEVSFEKKLLMLMVTMQDSK